MKPQDGFTLIELLILVAVVAILTTVAIPDFSATIRNDRDLSRVNSLLTGLTLARSEAIKTGTDVSICAGSNTTCGGSTWASGWIVYYNTLPPGAATSIIQVFPAISGNTTFTSNNSYRFTFQANGMLTPTPLGPVTFTLCDSRGATYARAISLSATGLAEAATTVGYGLDGSTPLTCP